MPELEWDFLKQYFPGETLSFRLPSLQQVVDLLAYNREWGYHKALRAYRGIHNIRYNLADCGSPCALCGETHHPKGTVFFNIVYQNEDIFGVVGARNYQLDAYCCMDRDACDLKAAVRGSP